MTRRRFPFVLTLISLSALGLGAAGCSNGSSPTEPAFTEETAAVSASVSDDKRRGRGADDPAGDDNGGRRGRGGDDANDDRGGRRGGRNGGNGAGNNGNNGGQQAPRGGVEFESAVASVNGGTLVLANGQRVVVTGQTQWIARGDLHSLDQVAAALSSGDDPRVEGRGNRQGNGAIVALTIKAEVDD